MSISVLPFGVLLHHLAPFAPWQDLAALGQTDRHWRVLLRTEELFAFLYARAVQARRLSADEVAQIVRATAEQNTAFTLRGRTLLQLLASYHGPRVAPRF